MKSKTLPKYIYKFLPINKRTIENLINKQVYFNAPILFNDPLDCSNFTYEIDEEFILYKINEIDNTEYINLKNIPLEKIEDMHVSIKKALIKLRDSNLERFGCCSFSKTFSNTLMWSHYSNSHKGICLKFSTSNEPFNKPIKVTYSKKYPNINLNKWLIEKDESEYFKLLCTKSLDWKYEKEYRILHHKSKELISYENTQLNAIYFGLRTSNEDINLIKKLFIKNNEIIFYKAKGSKDFKIEFTKI